MKNDEKKWVRVTAKNDRVVRAGMTFGKKPIVKEVDAKTLRQLAGDAILQVLILKGKPAEASPKTVAPAKGKAAD